MKNKKLLLYSIYLTVFIDALGTGIIFPVIPALFFNANLGFLTIGSMDTVFMYSLTLAVFPLFQMFGMPCLGVLSDKYGRKKIMLISLCIVFMSYILSVIAIFQHDFLLFLLYRSLAGFFGGVMNIANALIGDLNDKSNQKFAAFRLASSADKLGLLLGPALAVFITQTPHCSNELAIPFAITTVLALCNLLLISFGFKKSENKNNVKSSEKIQWSNLFNTAYEAIRLKNTRWLMLTFLCFQFGAALFFQSVPLYLTIHMKYAASQLGLFFLVMSVIVIISTIFFGKLLAKQHATTSRKIKFIFVVIVFIFSFATILLFVFESKLVFDKITQIWIVSGVFYFLNPLIKLLFTTLFSKNVENDKQGWIMGSMGQAMAFAYCVSGFLVAPIILNHLVALTSAILFIVAFFCYLQFLLKRKNTRHP